ncbi:hypothetical protein RFI_26876 [Reticulomyxa filosa]|uniref:PH domain-containing protein n=1 Tax=Reticulomyxa filosa TaxID=46433 RepID=X6MA26_RETFI|nr:hypothetical protein RFI_26876 [Reticulomyxa filosa]|eukprot:ETO10501.1 hypothetical protein RFI_26876 [Reticulomyxa filosa]
MALLQNKKVYHVARSKGVFCINWKSKFGVFQWHQIEKLIIQVLSLLLKSFHQKVFVFMRVGTIEVGLLQSVRKLGRSEKARRGARSFDLSFPHQMYHLDCKDTKECDEWVQKIKHVFQFNLFEVSNDTLKDEKSSGDLIDNSTGNDNGNGNSNGTSNDNSNGNSNGNGNGNGNSYSTSNNNGNNNNNNNNSNGNEKKDHKSASVPLPIDSDSNSSVCNSNSLLSMKSMPIDEKSMADVSWDGIETIQKIEQVWYLTLRNIRHLERLLSEGKKEFSDFETDNSVRKAIAWYERLEDLRLGLQILLTKRDVVQTLRNLSQAETDFNAKMKEARDLIFKDIVCYARDNMSDGTIVRLNRACLLMEEIPSGKDKIVNYIIQQLAHLNNLDKVLVQYVKIKEQYQRQFRPFLPKRWDIMTQLITTFSAQIINEINDLLDSQPMDIEVLTELQRLFSEFEKELMDDMLRSILSIEVDVRSWCDKDQALPVSWIKIDDKDYRKRGNGLSVVAIGIDNRNTWHSETFDVNVLKNDFNAQIEKFLSTVNESSLVVMTVHYAIGKVSHHGQWKQLQVDASQLPSDNESFVFIGVKKSSHDSTLWTRISACEKRQVGDGPCQLRRVVDIHPLSTDKMMSRLPQDSSHKLFVASR